jgi:hypothetical protein
MRPILALLAFLFLLFAFVLVWNDPANVAQRELRNSIARQAAYDRLERERREADRQEERREWQQSVDQFTVPVTRVVVTATVTTLIVALPVLGVAGAVLFFRRRAALAYPDAAGRLPVQLADAEYQRIAAAALGAFHQTQHTLAATSYAVPANYAPHISYAYDHGQVGSAGAGALSTEPAARAPDAADIVTFADLLASGRIGRGQPLVIGQAGNGQLLRCQWERLYSSAIGGLSGSGKSWTAASLIAQSLLSGAHVALIDPDAADANSLSSRLAPLAGRFLADPAEDDQQIRHLLDLLLAEFERRKNREQKGKPLIIAVDEYNDLARSLPQLADLIDLIGRRGRRQGMFAVAMSHQWQGKKVGGAEIRDVFASAFVHRLRPSQVRMLTGLTAADLPDDVLQLPDGTAYLIDTRGQMQRVAIPRMVNSDVARVAGLLEDNHPVMARAVPGEPGCAPDAEPTRKERAEPGSPGTDAVRGLDDDALIAELVRRGRTANEIHKAVGGTRAKVLEKIRTVKEKGVL